MGQETENDLKRLSKAELVQRATDAGIENAEAMTIADLIPAILSKNAPDGAATDPAASASDAKASEAPASEASARSSEPTAESEGLITVRSANRERTPAGGYRQVFRERHPDHPDGQAWIANDKPHRVAPTTAVKRAIVDGVLEQL